MLCSTCGNKIQFMEGAFICEICDSEFDISDLDECLIPIPLFVVIELTSQHAIIDTRKQEVYVKVDKNQKAHLITELLNEHFAQAMIKEQLSKYLDH